MEQIEITTVKIQQALCFPITQTHLDNHSIGDLYDDCLIIYIIVAIVIINIVVHYISIGIVSVWIISGSHATGHCDSHYQC